MIMDKSYPHKSLGNTLGTGPFVQDTEPRSLIYAIQINYSQTQYNTNSHII